VAAGRVRVVALGVEDERLYYRGHSSVASKGWQSRQITDQDGPGRNGETGCPRGRRTRRRAHQLGRGGRGRTESALAAGARVVRIRPPPSHRTRDMVYAVEMAARAKFEATARCWQVLPQDFTVDGQAPLAHPLNIEALRLEAHALLVTCSEQEHQALVSAVHQASLKLRRRSSRPMAAAYASILAEERQGGAALIDIGAHSTNLSYYDGDSMLFAVGIPISGDHFTMDVGKVRALSYEESEWLKLNYGCALTGLSADNIVIGIRVRADARRVRLRAASWLRFSRPAPVQLFQLHRGLPGALCPRHDPHRGRGAVRRRFETRGYGRGGGKGPELPSPAGAAARHIAVARRIADAGVDRRGWPCDVRRPAGPEAGNASARASFLGPVYEPVKKRTELRLAEDRRRGKG